MPAPRRAPVAPGPACPWAAALLLALALPGALAAARIADAPGPPQEAVGASGDGSAARSDRTPAPRAQDRRRAFRHVSHEALTCRDCHTAGTRHRVPREWTPRDCASCHHDPARALACDACHDPADFAPARLTTATMDLSVWDAPRTRDLPFDHGRHALACTECHQTPVSLAPTACGSCHERHTSARIACANCHRPPPPRVHDLDAHVTCTGGRCHTGAATVRPMRERQSCLVCHRESESHRPGRECVDCHFIPPGAAAAGLRHAVPREPHPSPPR